MKNYYDVIVAWYDIVAERNFSIYAVILFIWNWAKNDKI